VEAFGRSPKTVTHSPLRGGSPAKATTAEKASEATSEMTSTTIYLRENANQTERITNQAAEAATTSNPTVGGAPGSMRVIAIKSELFM